MHQLVQWMENPVPKDKMNDWLGCVPGGNAAGAVGATTTPAAVPEPAPAAPVPEAAPVAPVAPVVADVSPVPEVVAAQPKADGTAVPASSAQQRCTVFGALAATMTAAFILF
jgi:hypothetical protein